MMVFFSSDGNARLLYQTTMEWCNVGPGLVPTPARSMALDAMSYEQLIGISEGPISAAKTFSVMIRER